MLRAVALARRGFPAPNPRVGCVLAQGSKILAEGYHDHAGGPHAEAMALAIAGKRAKGCDAYVTLEPCNHHGRTPPCAQALIDARVRSVWVAVRDPNPQAAGGIEALRQAGLSVSLGLCEREAENVNVVFLTAERRRTPYVAAKLATTMDGFVARPDGSSKWITGPKARAVGHRLRAEMGAVMVGRRTVELDRPQLTARIRGVVNQPLRVVLDPHGRLDGTGPPFDQPGPTLWIVSDRAPEGRGTLRLPWVGGRFDPKDVLGAIWAHGSRAVLIEGGPATIGRYLNAGLVDRIDWFVAPRRLGAGLAAWTHGSPGDGLDFRPTSCRVVGGDVWMVFERFRTIV